MLTIHWREIRDGQGSYCRRSEEGHGTVKEKVGRALGDAKTAAEGKREKDEGRAQAAIGHVKDAVREITGKK